jgi:hypothetical protein
LVFFSLFFSLLFSRAWDRFGSVGVFLVSPPPVRATEQRWRLENGGRWFCPFSCFFYFSFLQEIAFGVANARIYNFFFFALITVFQSTSFPSVEVVHFSRPGTLSPSHLPRDRSTEILFPANP